MTRGSRWAAFLALALPFLLTILVLSAPATGAGPAILKAVLDPIDRPLTLISADLNRDGYDDLVTANFQAGTLTIMFNQKDGTFAPAPGSPEGVGLATFNTPTSGPLSIAVADLNPEDVDGDGIPNSTDDCPNTYNPANCPANDPLGSPACAITVTCTDTVKAPIDCAKKDPVTQQCDSDLDGVGDQCQILDSACAPVDTDGDGVEDYSFNPLTSKGSLDNCPMRSNPLQEATTAAGADGTCGTADDNPYLFGPDKACGGGDDLTESRVGQICASSPDLVVLGNGNVGGTTAGFLRVRINDGKGGFSTRASKITGAGAAQVLLADFTGDHLLDMVESNSASDSLILFPGAANGFFGTTSPQKTLTAGNGPEGITAADFNGDGALDLAVANRTAGTIGLYLNKAGTLPATADMTIVLGPKVRPTVLLSGDLGAGPLPDLVVLEQGGGQSICAGGTQAGLGCVKNSDCTGGGTCATGMCVGGTLPGAACTADPDCTGGGTCDLGGSSSAGIEVYTSSVPPASFAMTLAQSLPFTGAARPRGGVLRDLDGDAKLDLALVDFTDGELRFYRGSGSGTFTPDITRGGLSHPADLVALDYDLDGDPDLAVVDSGRNRTDIFRNDGPMDFNLAGPSTTPVSPWRNTSAIAMFGADASTAIDIVLMHSSPPRLDVLSGIGNGYFRTLPPLTLKEATTLCAAGLCVGGARDGLACAADAECPGTADAMAVSDLTGDGRPDIVVADKSGGRVETLLAQSSGTFVESGTATTAAAPAGVAVGSLILDDFDRDGVPDLEDDCPTIYNPPNCPANDPVGFPACAITVTCTDTSKAPIDCAKTDPVTGQCDSDLNGVGDRCQILSTACAPIDSDSDGIKDYDPVTMKLDNCPQVANPGQEDRETSAGPDNKCDNGDDHPSLYGPDGLCGTADDCGPDLICGSLTEPCITGICNGGPRDGLTCTADADCPGDDPPAGNHVGDACAEPDRDIVAVSPSTGTLTILAREPAGNLLHPAYSTQSGFSTPSSTLIGKFSVACPFLATCSSRPASDLLVATSGVAGNFSDDRVTVLEGDGLGGFTAESPVVVQGDPSGLLVAPDQKVCAEPQSIFEADNSTNLVAVLEPGTSTIEILRPSTLGLLPPSGRAVPLPVPGQLADAQFVDLNRDGVMDLVAVSRGDGNPTTLDGAVTIYLGIANGLFYTDPSFDLTGLPDGLSLLATGNVNQTVDFLYPEVVLYSEIDAAPLVLTNVVRERTDIDGSGRVDGFDLAILAAAFGSTRGEDFTILGPASGALDGTLQQTGSGYSRILVGSGTLKSGHDIPDSNMNCDTVLQPLTGAYGLPVDINLDGVVDGTDLALLASYFGVTF